jgi:hypothetical protein
MFDQRPGISGGDPFSMLKDGQYTAWFRTSRGEGTGIVRLADGGISGGDSFFNYSGSYEVQDDRFTATLTIKRSADGPTPTVFGLDEVEVRIAGMLKGTLACCTGSSEQAPGVPFEATLFLGPDQPPPNVPPASGFNLAKLPKTSNERYRGRNPFGPGSSR